MAGKVELKAIISAVDKLTPTLKGITRSSKIARKAIADMGAAGSRLKSELGIPISLLGAATVASLAAATKSFADYGSEINDASTKLGILPKQLQELKFAAKLNGVEFGSLTSGMVKLNKAIATAASGKNKEAAGLFKKLGISLKDSNGNFKTSAELMPEIADAIMRIKNPAQRTLAAMTLFGKSGADLIPVLQGGSEGFKAVAREAAELGLVLSSEDIAAADDLGDNLDRISAAGQGLANTIGSQLAPILNPLITKLLEWYKANRLIISSKISEVVKSIAASLESVNWAAFYDGVSSAARGVNDFAKMIGGWKNLLIGLVVVMNAGVIASLIQIGISAFALSKVMLVLSANTVIAMASFARFAAVQVIAFLGNFIYALRAGTGAMWALNFALTANPIGAVIVAVAALAAGLVYLYNNSETVRNAINSLIDTMANFLKSIPQTFSKLWELREYLQFDNSDINVARNTNATTNIVDKRGDGRTNLISAPAAAQANGANVSGQVTVKFENAPKGMSVAPAQTNQSKVGINTDVGYSSWATPG